VDLGDHSVEPGEPVVLFGDGQDGAPTADDWAEAADTISYEIVTRISGRFHRRHVSSKGLSGS
jgi:alanine racemase